HPAQPDARGPGPRRAGPAPAARSHHGRHRRRQEPQPVRRERRRVREGPALRLAEAQPYRLLAGVGTSAGADADAGADRGAGGGGGSGRWLRAGLRLRGRRRGDRRAVRGGGRRRAMSAAAGKGAGAATVAAARTAATATVVAGSATLRQPTLETLGLGGVLDIFRRGALPADAEALVERVFGPKSDRGALVISGASGIVGAGKTMQLGSRLEPFGVRVGALDLPGAPDGLGRQWPGLVQAFGREGAARIMGNVVRLTYDGRRLPEELKALKPRFLLEAIPEVLEAKRAHYQLFRETFPGIEIRSVTSGFPSQVLGVPIAHPAFPHEINKVWETVEAGPSAVPQLLWALGLI